MTTFTDQMGREVLMAQTPQRIVSLVPSQTELLYDLGLGDRVVGITKFCVHPNEWFRSKTRIGGTKQLHIDQILALNPDLIIANKEENTQVQVEALMKDFPVWISDIQSLEDALEMILTIGELTASYDRASILVKNIKSSFDQLSSKNTVKKSVAYLIWEKPMMVAASHTFIDELIRLAGFENVFQELSRYPEISEAEIVSLSPDYIFLSSEPFPFKDKHIQKYQQLCPTAKTLLVDGELFSWYGSRLLHSADYFMRLHQELSKG